MIPTFASFFSQFQVLTKKSQQNLSMPHMELRSIFTTCFLLLILILALPRFSKGESEEMHAEIYEIDYRGPETHSSGVPPPHHSHIGKQHATHHSEKGSVRGTKTLGLRDGTYDENKVKKVHG